MVKKVIAVNSDNNTDAQDKVLEGAKFLSDGLKKTFGPYGLNWLTEKGLSISNDGYKISKELGLDDEISDLVLRKAKEACTKTDEEVGDFTTTVAILNYVVLKELVRLMPGKNLKGKMSMIQIRKKLKGEVDFVVKRIKELSTEVKSKEELIEVALVSSEDDTLAKLIGGTQYDLGKDGIIIPEETNNLEDSVELVEGVRFDNGFGSSLVVNNQEKQRLEVYDTSVIMSNYTFNNLDAIRAVMAQIVHMELEYFQSWLLI